MRAGMALAAVLCLSVCLLSPVRSCDSAEAYDQCALRSNARFGSEPADAVRARSLWEGIGAERVVPGFGGYLTEFTRGASADTAGSEGEKAGVGAGAGDLSEKASGDTTGVGDEATGKGAGRPEERGDAAGDTTGVAGDGEALQDTTGAERARDDGAVRPAESRSAEMGAYRTLWERAALLPEVRWFGSGALGGVENLSLRGRGFRRGSALLEGVVSVPDLNVFAPSLVDSLHVSALMDVQEEPLSDGGEVIRAESHVRMWEQPVGLLFMGRGGFSSSFNAFTFGRRIGPFSFALDLVGRSFGRAASYEGYSSDSAALKGVYEIGSHGGVTLAARKFRSDLRRYTSDRSKSRLDLVSLGAGTEREDAFSWKALCFYSGNEFVYPANGPEVEDDISTYGFSLEADPLGVGGGHKMALSLRREALERSYKPFVPPEVEPYSPPDEGDQRSTDATAVYRSVLRDFGRIELRGLARVDHRELFGWVPSFSLALVGSGLRFGEFKLEAGRSAFVPGLIQIYSPRDETARPSWFMVEEMDPETGWEVVGSLRWASGGWTIAGGGFGALREHVLVPSSGALGFQTGFAPALTSPVEDSGDGSALGLWGSCAWAPSPWFGAGGWFSAQRSRAGGFDPPFQPARYAGLWLKGESKYFSDDLTVGVVLRGRYYSAQKTPTREELPSYGVGEVMGYASISDMVFFYQIKNLETRERPSPILDRPTGRYLLQPGAEVRVGLVWYLPG